LSFDSPKAFTQVDVFGTASFAGNPVAVVHEADDLSDTQMAAFARWTNLSETTFLLRPTRPEADYRLRIFTPGGELPFAGHPTLGSCHAWLDAGAAPADAGTIVQECGVGLVSIKPMDDALYFAAPPLRRSGPLDAALLERLAAALDLPPKVILGHQWVDNGPPWCALLLDSAERVLSVRPDFAALGSSCLGLIGPHPAGATADFEVRAFVPSLGVPEAPVTGSLNAGIAQWLIAAGLAPERYTVTQGTALQRAGMVRVHQIGAETWVGGAASSLIKGQLRLD
jgi:PhzF family phenazine biosynthesis protein